MGDITQISTQGLSFLVGRQSRAVRPMLDRRFTRENAVQDLALLQVDDIESDVAAKANVRDTILAVDGVRKHPALAHILDLADDAVVGSTEDRQRGLRTEEREVAIQTRDAVVGPWPDRDSPDELAVLRVHHQKATVLALFPPTPG